MFVSVAMLAAVLCLLPACSNESNDPVLEVPEDPVPEPVNPEDMDDGPALDNALKLSKLQLDRLTSVNGFSLGMLSELDRSSGGKSVVFSPLGVIYALGMGAETAKDPAVKELANVLGFPGRLSLHRFCRKFIEGIPAVDDAVELAVANGVFVNSAFGQKLPESWCSVWRENYDAAYQEADFSDPKTLTGINAWCSGRTSGKISSPLSELKPSALFCLVNALYFKADWLAPFSVSATHDGRFVREDGSETTVTLMYQETRLPYFENEFFQVCSFPYANDKFSMHVVLPRKGRSLNDVLGLLTTESLAEALSSQDNNEKTEIVLPRFSTCRDGSLVATLQKLGIRRIFQSGELTGGLELDDCFQSTVINVNEKGTEAASVTYSEGGTYGLSRVFAATRPFFYFISEKSTGAILFMGTYRGD